MPSFDAVLEPNLVELRNAVEQASKEIATRFDFKGSSAAVELAEKANKGREITLFGDSDFQLAQVRDLLLAKAAKRNLDARFLDFSAKPEKLGGDKLKQLVLVKTGIDSDNAKKMQAAVKQSKLKVQAQIQGDVLRVSGAKRDDLQACMRLLKQQMAELPLSFTNFRD
jgi:cyclic-di-GMP-binding protein